MKRIVLFIITLSLICFVPSCRLREKEPNYESSDLEFLLLEKSSKETPYINSNEYKEFLQSVRYFSSDLSEKIYLKYQENYDTYAVSPISIYMALAMATAVASPEAQDELTQLLGSSYQEIIEYTKYLYSQLNGSYYDDYNNLAYMIQLSNSIWLNDNVSFKHDGLELLQNNFYTDCYKAPFSTKNDAANKAVKDYVYRNTKGLINSEYNFSPLTLFLLINTLYIKDSWNNLGDELKFTPNKYAFKNIDGSTKDMQLLTGNYLLGQIQKEDGFEYFYTTTTRGLKLYFIKPTTKTLEEIYTHNNLNKVLEKNDYQRVNDILKEEYYTRCLFPKFEAKFNNNLVPLLEEEYNIKHIFDDSKSNFNKVTDDECYTSEIVHQTKLIVDEVGIEGAAVTIMSNAGTAMPDEQYKKIYQDFIIDQGFGFIISKNDTILFSGVVKNL